MSTEAAGIIRRPDKGLTIAGTRVTLYTLLDYLQAGWSQADIRDWLGLTDEQLQVALKYIAAHRAEVAAEHTEVVRQAEEQRRYWEKRAHEHLARQPAMPLTPEKAALYERLAKQRAETIRQLARDDKDEHAEAVRSP